MPRFWTHETSVHDILVISAGLACLNGDPCHFGADARTASAARPMSPCPLSGPVALADRQWAGDVFVADSFALYVGPLAITPVHHHHAIQLVLGVEKAVAVRHPGGVARANAVWVDSEIAHAIDEAVSQGALIYWESASAQGLRTQAGRAGDAAQDHGVGALDDSELLGRLNAALTSGAGGAADGVAMVEVLRAVSASGDAGSLPPTLGRMVTSLPAMLPGAVRLADLARAAHVSPSRLTHLVRAHLGTTVRSYVRWQRLRAAARYLAQGETITQAAHSAGFADAAHMNRTFRRNLGLTPGSLANVVRWHVPD